MTRWQRRFVLGIVFESLLALGGIGYFLTRPKIPAIDFSQVDIETATIIAGHQQGMTLSNSQHWQSLAQLYLGFGYLPQAEICARQASELDAKSREAMYLWAVALDRLGRLDEAVEKLKQAQALGVGDASSYVRLGRLELRREAPAAAEEALRTALKKNEDESSAAISLARLLLRTDRAAEVESVMARYAEKDPRAHAPCQLMALAELEQGRRNAAEEWLLKAEWRPDYSRFKDPLADAERWGASCGALWWVTQSRAAAASGQDEAAAHAINHALTLGWDEKFSIEAATLSLKVSQPLDALTLLRHVVSVAGRSPKTSYLRGEAYLLQKKIPSAIDAWSESVRFRDTQEAQQRLAQSYQNKSDVEREHAARMFFALGIAGCQEGNPEQTAGAMTESLNLKPEQSMAWYFLGEARRVLGELPKAREAYERCLAIDPEHGRAREALLLLAAAADSDAEPKGDAESEDDAKSKAEGR